MKSPLVSGGSVPISERLLRRVVPWVDRAGFALVGAAYVIPAFRSRQWDYGVGSLVLTGLALGLIGHALRPPHALLRNIGRLLVLLGMWSWVVAACGLLVSEPTEFPTGPVGWLAQTLPELSTGATAGAVAAFLLSVGWCAVLCFALHVTLVPDILQIDPKEDKADAVGEFFLSWVWNFSISFPHEGTPMPLIFPPDTETPEERQQRGANAFAAVSDWFSGMTIGQATTFAGGTFVWAAVWSGTFESATGWDFAYPLLVMQPLIIGILLLVVRPPLRLVLTVLGPRARTPAAVPWTWGEVGLASTAIPAVGLSAHGLFAAGRYAYAVLLTVFAFQLLVLIVRFLRVRPVPDAQATPQPTAASIIDGGDGMAVGYKWGILLGFVLYWIAIY